ncbi:hypothetical protein EVG20_g5301 [Dentipellis fragilis]|uniref:Uncharacterized protein n=1 Tax=Dentipellis fragilis TaxID=205917 RepID=A0A4Y9YTA7_9AGAM|nr:hypothetical protein EVG20_g5301 [Dentipellis fragilis]
MSAPLPPYPHALRSDGSSSVTLLRSITSNRTESRAYHMAYVRFPTPGSTRIQHSKRDRLPVPNCQQLAPWLRLCWIDIVVICAHLFLPSLTFMPYLYAPVPTAYLAIVIATIVYVLWGIPLTIRMWRICRGRPPNTPPGSPIPSPSTSPSASPSPPSTSPKQFTMPTHFKQRRETMHALHFRTSSLPVENEKRASPSAFPIPRAPWLRRPSASLEYIPASPPTPSPMPCPPASAAASTSKDPYLFVNPSLDDSLLLRSGLVAPTARPEPALNAYDTHALFPSPPARSVPARRHSDAMLPMPTPGHCQGRGLRLSELPTPPPLSPPMTGHGLGHGRREGRRSYDEGRSSREERESAGVGIGTVAGLGLGMEGFELVLPPPPAYSQYPIGQGKREEESVRCRLSRRAQRAWTCSLTASYIAWTRSSDTLRTVHTLSFGFTTCNPRAALARLHLAISALAPCTFAFVSLRFRLLLLLSTFILVVCFRTTSRPPLVSYRHLTNGQTNVARGSASGQPPHTQPRRFSGLRAVLGCRGRTEGAAARRAGSGRRLND